MRRARRCGVVGRRFGGGARELPELAQGFEWQAIYSVDRQYMYCSSQTCASRVLPLSVLSNLLCLPDVLGASADTSDYQVLHASN